jgi:hypothetical protein
MEQWTSTQDKRVAAALAALGVIVRLNTTLRERTGEQKTHFHLSLASAEGRGVARKVPDTRKLLRRFKTGELENAEPGHPLLTILRAYENRRQLLACAMGGARIRLVEVKGAGTWQYVAGEAGLPGLKGHKDAFRTGDLNAAAALVTVGIPLLAIDGAAGRFNFYLPRYGPVRAGGLPPADGLELRAAWCADKTKMNWLEPFVQASHGLYARECMEAALDADQPRVLIEKARSTRSALVHIDAAPAAWDRVKDHFDR